MHYLLAAITTEAVLVFGGSLGALIGLDLVARYPQQVRTLVAHEAPAPQLLGPAERALAVRSQAEMEEIFQREGVGVAMMKFAAMAGINFTDREPDVDLPRPSPERAANLTFFLAHDAPAARRYSLDVAALQAAGFENCSTIGTTNDVSSGLRSMRFGRPFASRHQLRGGGPSRMSSNTSR